VRKPGTCDRHVCASCTTEIGPDKHLCPVHAAEAPQPGLF
jgi:RNA polymerase subunit RPABC4/transcription elongation factor Spt4